MQTLTMNEVTEVSGGVDQLNGYQGAGAIVGVVALGAAAGPVGWAVLGFAAGAAAGLAIAEWMSR